jgi:putative cardiolipin synthase
MFNFSKFSLLAAILVLSLIGGCATLPENFDRPESYAYTDTDDTRLAKDRRDEKLAHPGHSGFLLLGNGLDAFVARAVLVQSAERSIDVQYYLYHEDWSPQKIDSEKPIPEGDKKKENGTVASKNK